MKRKICFLVDSIFTIGGVQRVTAVIAKEVAKNYDVTVVTFDKTELMDTLLYGLKEADISYRFFAYPQVSATKKEVCRMCSGIYLKLQPQARWCSDLYARSSFPSESNAVSVTAETSNPALEYRIAPSGRRTAYSFPIFLTLLLNRMYCLLLYHLYR